MKKYSVVTETFCNGWVNCWYEGDALMTFDTIEAAQAEIDEYIDDMKQDILDGEKDDMFDSEEDKQAEIDSLGEDLRIIETETGNFVG